MKNLQAKRNEEQAPATTNKPLSGFMNSTCCVSFATESTSSPSRPFSFSLRRLTESKVARCGDEAKLLHWCDRPHDEKLKLNRMMNNSRPHNC